MDSLNIILSPNNSLPIGTVCGCLEVLENKGDKYLCKCRKCGKTKTYSLETLNSNPQYCFRPLYCSSSLTYSIRAQNATYRKEKKYNSDDSVDLVYSRDQLVPSEKYCEKWNTKRRKEIEKQKKKNAEIIAAIPRKQARNYEKDYVGTIYESLQVIDCVNDSLESEPVPHYDQQHHKLYSPITVYKQYRCRCYLCGKEQLVTCDKFGIFPPTEYGYTAYNGYWSHVFCNCGGKRKISSFQWIVNKLLIEHGISYRVEYSFPGLSGVSGGELRFDFAVFNHDGSINCLIECQGEQHYKPVEEFGGSIQFAAQKRNDEIKREYVKRQHIPLVEISYKDKKYEKVEAILKENGIIP